MGSDPGAGCVCGSGSFVACWVGVLIFELVMTLLDSVDICYDLPREKFLIYVVNGRLHGIMDMLNG